MVQKRKITKRTSNNSVISSKAGRQDIIKLKKIARKMVEHLEKTIEQCGTTSSNNSQSENKDLLFTGKNSLIAALIILTDLLLKLESTSGDSEDINSEDELARLPLSEADRELLKQFVARQHQAEEQ